MWMDGMWVTILNMVVRVGRIEKVTCEQSPKGVGSFGDAGEMLQVEGTARAKALREEGQEAASSS